MPTTCAEIICPTNCDTQLPEVQFSICAPVTNFGQISKIYQANDGYPLTDENDLAEWTARVNLPSSDPSRILEISVIGDLPLAADNTIALSRGREANGAKDRVVNIRIDETNDTNYEYMRKTECGLTGRFWIETYGGKLYGGPVGILATIKLGEIIPEGTTDLTTFSGSIKWKSKISPCRTNSPMAGIELLDEAGS